jgi:hypothetical protein
MAVRTARKFCIWCGRIIALMNGSDEIPRVRSLTGLFTVMGGSWGGSVIIHGRISGFEWGSVVVL